MKCSTSTMKAIRQLLIQDFEAQLETEGYPTANQLEQSLRSELQTIGQEIFGELLSRMDECQNSSQAKCECGSRAHRTARRPAQLLSVFGWVHYRRANYHCEQCGRRGYALDRQQQLRPGRATQPMAALLGLAGITVSFEEARHHIREYLQVEVGINTIRQETQLIGERQRQREREMLDRSQDLNHLQQRKRQPVEAKKRVYGSIDGVFVPLEQDWKEAKLVSWYQVGVRYGSPEPHAQDIQYHISLEDSAFFSDLVWATALEYQADRAQELVFVCDGAPWIWKLVEHNFPQAVQIVDWYHACQYLHPAAEALYATAEQRADWLAEMETLLWEGQVERILQKIRKLPKRVGAPAEQLLSYYSNNRQRMRYADFRRANYFIGSGTVESGCKQIVSMRLKRSGARWSKSGAVATAKARAAWLSNDWLAVTQLPLAV